MEKVKFPPQLILKFKNNAPTYDVSENYERRSGYYGDSDETAVGYKSVCIYVQNGLADYLDLFKEIARGLFRIQSEHQRKFPLVVFGFGNTNHLQHEHKYFDFGYLNDYMAVIKVAEVIARASGTIQCNPTIIPELFPKTDIRSLYYGKTSIERGDLLVIIGRVNEIFLNETLEDKITGRLRRQILLVEISQDNVSFKASSISFEFKPLNNSSITKPMATPVSTFKRNLSANLISNLQAEPLYPFLLNDIVKGSVFPAMRNNQVDFYFKGGNLFKYNDRGFRTHIKYAAVIEKDKTDYLTEKELGNYKLAVDFSNSYQRIKENCSIYSGIEATGVSEIYHRHSYVGRSEGIVVLDIEISLKSQDIDSTQDRIDILLYNADERKLKFVEAKHYSNSEIWSKNDAKVISQIKRYEAQIKSKKADIIAEYNKYIVIVNNLFNGNLPPVEDIDEKVTLLIFDFDNNQKSGRLKTLITDNPKFKGITLYPIGNVDKIKLENIWKKK